MNNYTRRSPRSKPPHPDCGDKNGSISLRRALTDLREALGTEAHRLVGDGYRALHWDAEGMTVDVHAFDAATVRWEKTGDIVAAQEAITLYRGSLLEGFDAPFLEGERAAREQTCLTLLEAVASHALTNGDPERALVLARRAETIDPLRQSCQRLLYQSLAAQGDPPAAERAYREFRIRLRSETGQEPDHELKKVSVVYLTQAGEGQEVSREQPRAQHPMVNTLLH